MSTTATRASVTVTAAKLSVGDVFDRYGKSMTIKNRGTASIFIGGPDVTTSIGYELGAGEQLTIQMFGNELYSCAASGTQRVDVLEVKNAG